MRIIHFLTAFAVAVFFSLPTFAQELELKITSQTGEDMIYTLDALEAMDNESFTTETIWLDGPVEFSGVPLSHLIQNAGLEGETLKLVALNDYAIEIPVDEITPDYPIVATRINGERMSVRDKGPLWVVYPYDSDDEFQTEVIYSRSIWQLSEITLAN